MPASEQTWRDQKMMHVVFGVTSLLMLFATLWMFKKDHNREWREWQLADRGKEKWAQEASLAEATAQSHLDMMKLADELSSASSQPVDSVQIEEFNRLVNQETARLSEAGIQPKTFNLEKLDSLVAEIAQQATVAAEARAAIEPAQQAARDAQVNNLQAAAGDADRESLKAAQQESKAAVYALQQADAARTKAEAIVAGLRGDLYAEMQAVIGEAKRREDAVTIKKKFEAANHTARLSELGLAIGGSAPQAEIDALQTEIDRLSEVISELDSEVVSSKEYRTSLESIVRNIKSDSTAIEKSLAAVETDLNRIAENRDKNTWNVGEWITRWPILNALYDGNVRIEQIWLPDMLIDYNFSSVPRYDRCVTCHRAIDKTAPGSAVEPAYPTIPEDERHRNLAMISPDDAPAEEVAADGTITQPTLESVYGFALASAGQVDRYAVTVQYVLPESLAAQAGLQMGDIIEQINDGRVYSNEEASNILLSNIEWGDEVSLSIQRGLDQPFTSHPRLDLYLGSMSPHLKEDVGCTICHDGQGSASDFKWASHTPNNPNQALDWSREHGWFDNHHWIFPMMPERFIESNCLKCHHDVYELEPSERFPEPPAPNLVSGFHLVRDYGCFGCHEINGYDGPDKRIGPDLRLEPNFHEVAAALLQDESLTEEERSWAASLIEAPDSDSARHKLLRSITEDKETGEEARLAAASHELGDALKDVETPGTLRKAGPSLRYISSKVDYEWLYSWIRKPADFRPSTKMPQFFGQHEHLEGHLKQFPNAAGEPNALTDKEFTEQYERIEIRALTEFLLNHSNAFAYLDQPEGITEQPSPERGKWLFESRGCLACHSHKEMPGIAADQGPDLSELATKFNSGKGQRWLYTWLREPHRYHARTVMPNVYLDPIAEVDESGNSTGVVTDPAADILAYLLSVPSDWQPTDVPSRELTADDEAVLQQLTAEWLSAVYPKRRADRYAVEGIPQNQAAGIKGDELALVGMTSANRTEKQLEYVARRTIGRYGCFGCHDIPGYETAKPIGTALAGWGRKEPSKLAFENIGAFLASHGLDGEADHGAHDEHADAEHVGGHHGLDPMDFDDDKGYYLQAINSHQRQGFIWQKLRMPRTYDYEKTRNIRYDERLRMPKFPLTEQEREQVITFVLGLTTEAPAERYIYDPDPRSEALVAGREVLDKFNCGGCHVIDMETWKFAISPDWFYEPPVMPEFPSLQPNVPEGELEASLATDRRGLQNVLIHGMPVYSQETGLPNIVDEDGVPLEPDDDESEPFYEFTLYRDAVVSGYPRLVGVQNLLIPAKSGGYGPANGTSYPAYGGDLFRYLFPRVIEEEKKTNPQANGSEAWGWLPPPLSHEGRKVQTEWLHGFLMDPHPLRPAAVMRMPNFRMTAEDASKLVNYFAAKDNADWPYEYNSRRREGYLASLEAAHPGRLDDAMKIVTDGNYCVKCHAVGDYAPKGAIKTQGPQLSNVYERLRPQYVRDWIANPKRILPYTGMPVNIPYDANAEHLGGVSQDLYHGTSIDQLDGVVDLLMNFDEYAKRQTDIGSMVQEAPEDGQAAEASQPRDDQSAKNETNEAEPPLDAGAQL